MCGILGVVERSGRDAYADGIRRGLDAIRHRGPDASGYRELAAPGASAVLGAVRLRIIDLSPAADQPLPNEDETVWVAFNGELYNFGELRADLERAGHAFRSKSDTEVLVHLYEETGGDAHRMLGRLRGMFAFAVFDTRDGRLLLARDRLGIKPVYWTPTPAGVAFGSEIRSLAAAGFTRAEPDVEALTGYLLRGVVPAPRTAFDGVHELPPGCVLTWAGGDRRIERWWRPEIRADGRAPADAEDELAATLDDAVQRHLVSDRPLGVFLSSGMDSGSVATVAARHADVRAFTVTFADADGDEGPAAARVAARIGAQHQQVETSGADVARDLDWILRSMDQPTSDGVNTWLVCRAAHDAGFVVAVSGLGGDELFGGYSTFGMVPRVARLRALAGLVPARVRAELARIASRRSPGGRATRALAAEAGLAGAYDAVRGLFAPAELGLRDGYDRNGRASVTGAGTGDPRDAVTLLEATTYMPDQLLRDTDQMSMAHSLEVRVPLLDDAVVRTALSIPAEIRAEPGKALLARAAGFEPVANKRPFALPFDRWIAGPLRDTVREGLLSEALPFGDLVPRGLRRSLWERLDRVHWSRPWAVTVLRRWPGANGLDWQ